VRVVAAAAHACTHLHGMPAACLCCGAGEGRRAVAAARDLQNPASLSLSNASTVNRRSNQSY